MNNTVRISLCMIMKNEEKFLPSCLQSVTGAVDEIVIADTGSTDSSVEIARSFNARVVNFPWQDDFSAARNFSLSHCTGDWILYLDADEVLSPESIPFLRQAVQSNSADAFFCSLYSVDDIGGRPNTMHYLRLFRNKPNIRFTGRVHEQIDSAIKNGNYRTAHAQIRLIHYGYNLTKTELKKKGERNLLLLQKQFAEKPDDYTAFQIAQTYGILEQTDAAIPYFKTAAASHHLHSAYRAHAYRYLAAAALEQGNKSEAAGLIQNGLATGEQQPLLFVIAAKISYASGSVEQGRAFFAEALKINGKLVSGELQPFFDIMIDPAELALYVMEFSVNAGDKELFSTGYNALLTAGPVTGEVELLNCIFNGTEIKKSQLQQWLPDLKENHLAPVLVLITRFMAPGEALNLLQAILTYHRTASVALALAETAAKAGNSDEADLAYRLARTLDPASPAVLFSYISRLAEQNKLESAFKELCSFSDFQILPVHTKEKIEALKTKLADILAKP